MADTVPRRGQAHQDGDPAELFGRYQLIRKLGEGVRTEVFQARVAGPKGFEKTCALERLGAEYVGDEGAKEAFRARARLASRLHHPNLVEIYDVGQHEGHPYIAREYVDGLPLADYLEARRLKGEPPPLALALYVTGELCRALAYLGGLSAPDGTLQPVTHGNVVPSAILIGRQGTVKLTDFGSPDAMTPTRSEDIKAVARLCQTMILGHEASDAEALRFEGVPPRLAAVLRRAISGALDPDGLQDGILDFGFDAGIRISDWALTEALRSHDGFELDEISSPTTRPLGTPRPQQGESVYRLKSGAGSMLGHLSASNIISMLQSAALTSSAEVSVDHGPWQALSTLPIFAEHAPQDVPEAPPLVSAALDPLSLPTLVARIGIERLSGCLRVERGEALKQFWFRRGVPVHSTSNAEEELLGPSMVRAGLIDTAALQAAQTVIAAEGGLLGEVLLRHGLCSAGALHRGLEEQLKYRFQGLVEWPVGHLRFIEGDEPVGEVFRMSYDAVHLVTHTVRSAYDAPRILGLLQPWLDAQIVIETEGPVTHDNLRLNGRELRQLVQLSQGMSLREQLQFMGGDHAQRKVFLRVVFLLYCAQILDFTSALTKPRRGRRR